MPEEGSASESVAEASLRVSASGTKRSDGSAPPSSSRRRLRTNTSTMLSTYTEKNTPNTSSSSAEEPAARSWGMTFSSTEQKPMSKR